MQEIADVRSSEPIQAVNVNACAIRLGVSTRAIYRLIEQGEMQAFRVGRALRIPIVEIERYVASHMEHAEVR